MVYAAVAAAVLGTVMAVMQSRQQANIAEAQAEATDIAGQRQAQIHEEESAFAARQQQRELRLALGQSRATYGATGIASDFGSPLASELDLLKQGTLQALAIRRSGINAAESTRWTSGVSSSMNRYQARSLRAALPFQILGGAAKAVGAYYGAGKPTMLSDLAYENTYYELK